MAKWSESDRESVDALIAVWRESCLVEGKSLLFADEAIWTPENTATLMQRFVEEELLDNRSFKEKLSEQLDGVDRGAAILMAEVIAVYLAFASQHTIGGVKKIEVIDAALIAANEKLPEEGLVYDAMWGGIGGVGQGFNQGRPFLIQYVIRFADALLGESQDRRAELVSESSNPWAFQAWLGAAIPEVGGHGRTMRNILLHLLFPDNFERIAVDDDKSEIVWTFADLVPAIDPNEEDVDRALLAIRQEIEELLPEGLPDIGVVDFYYPPLVEGWRADDTRSGRGENGGLSSLEALRYKKQVVYYGPPGTGKTYAAKRLAEQLIRSEAMRRWGPAAYLQNEARVQAVLAEQVERRQLHPAYTYEDFIAGLRLEGNSTVTRKGHLLDLVDRLRESEKAETEAGLEPLPWVLILDELNRSDLSRLLGEVFSALDDREAKIKLSAAGTESWEPFQFPKDLFVVGTMNLIDQSVEQLDFALRRRFFWLLADFRADLIASVVGELWQRLDLDELPWLKRHPWDEVEADIELLAARATELNTVIEDERLLGPQYKIGHTYLFEVVGLIAQWPTLKSKNSWRNHYLWSRNTGKPLPPLFDLWAYSLRPLLSEYLAGLPSDAREQLLRNLGDLFLAPVKK